MMGVAAYTHFSTFTRLAASVDMTPEVGAKGTLARLAVAEYARYTALEQAAIGYGFDLAEAMGPFVPVIDEYHRRTRAADWVESLLKTYVGDGLTADLHRMLAERIDPDVGALIVSTLAHQQEEDFSLRALREALARHPDRVGRLTLYARKLRGEAMTRARAALRRAQSLADVTGADPGPLGEPQLVLARLGQFHEGRMNVLGLAT